MNIGHSVASFPGFPSSFPSLVAREKRSTANNRKLEGKPGNEARHSDGYRNSKYHISERLQKVGGLNSQLQKVFKYE